MKEEFVPFNPGRSPLVRKLVNREQVASLQPADPDDRLHCRVRPTRLWAWCRMGAARPIVRNVCRRRVLLAGHDVRLAAR